MAFIDNVKNKLTQAGQTTVQKAKGLSDVARLNAQISGLETEINDMYRQIGYAVYCAHHDDPLPECAGAINRITELHESIESCRAQIKAINAADTCPQCGAKISRSMVFCGSCGFRLPEQQPAAEQPAAQMPVAAEQPVAAQQPVEVQPPVMEQPPVIEQPVITGQPPVQQPAAQTYFCGSCGTSCPPGSAFCPSCGTPVKLQ